MTTLADSILKVEQSLAQDRGPFTLFALFLREDAPDRWDLVVSSPWTEEDKEGAFRLISEKVKEALPTSELLRVSRIVLVGPTDPAVQAINRAFRVEHSVIEVRDSTFFGMAIRHAYIFASAGVAPQAPEQPRPSRTPRKARRTAAHG